MIEDDATLLKTYVRDRSEPAFAELVRRHLTLVYSAAMRRTGGDSHRANDVSQIVFSRLAREAASLGGHTALTGWLYVATRNAAIDLVRTERRRQQREEKAHLMEEILSSPESSADWDQLRPVLDAAMDELDARDREAVLLRFFESQPFSRVAEMLRVNEDAARKRVDRALDKLGALLARRGITSTGGALAVLLANQTTIAAPAGVAASITTAALAGVGATAAGAGTVGLFIMSTSKAVTGISAAVALIAIGTAVYQTNVAREAKTALASAETQRAALHTQTEALDQRSRRADDALAAARKELADARASVAQSAAAPVGRPPASQSGAAMDYVLEHPETQPAFIQQQALRAKVRFERFLKASGLAPEKQAQFLEALKDQAARELDFMASLHVHGFGVGNVPQDPQARAQFQQLLNEHRQNGRAAEAKLAALLGDEQFRAFQRYTSTIAERNVADQIASQLYYTDTPLTGQQAEQLAQVLVQNRFTPQAEPSPTSTLNGTFITPQALNARVGQAMQQGGMNLMDWLAPVTDAAIARAQTVLAPPQLAMLKQVQAQQVTQFQLAPPPPLSGPGAPNAGSGK